MKYVHYWSKDKEGDYIGGVFKEEEIPILEERGWKRSLNLVDEKYNAFKKVKKYTFEESRDFVKVKRLDASLPEKTQEILIKESIAKIKAGKGVTEKFLMSLKIRDLNVILKSLNEKPIFGDTKRHTVDRIINLSQGRKEEIEI